MEKQDNLKLFTAKLIDFVFFSNKSTLKHDFTQDKVFQIETPAYSHIHNEIDYFWEEKSSRTKEFCVEIFQRQENCIPLLIERWNFILKNNPSKESFKAYYEFSSIFRSLASACYLFPSSKIDLKDLFIRDSHLHTDWPSSLASSDILQFPSVPYQLSSSYGSLLVFVQYYTKALKPMLCTQMLGERPRLYSVGSFEIPEHIHSRTYSCIDSRSKALATVSNDTLYEEEEIGIKLISSEYGEYSDFDDKEFGKSSFDMEIDVTENVNTPEEAKISLYMLSCDKIRDLRVFKPMGDLNPQFLINSWRNSEYSN